MVWILIVAMVTTERPVPKLLPPRTFDSHEACVKAAFRMDETSLAPFVRPGERPLDARSPP